MTAKPPISETKKRERFQRRGKHLVVSTRISFDPKQDAGIIALLRGAEPNGMAHLIRTALRVCYQAGQPAKNGSKKINPRIDLLDGDVGVILSGQTVTPTTASNQIVIYRTDIQHVMTELAIAQAKLMNRAVVVPEGVTLPLVTKRK
jgi:hypothetical protein